MIKALAAFISFVNNIPDGGSLGEIPLGALIGGSREPGGFSVDAAKAGTTVSSTEAGSLIKQDANFKGGSGFTEDVGNAGGGALRGRPPRRRRGWPARAARARWRGVRGRESRV